MSRELEDRISRMAAGQHGVITRAQLMEAGVSASAVARRLGSGRLRSLFRGVYLEGPVAARPAREMAAVLAGGANAVLSHWSAASLWHQGWIGQANVGVPNDSSISDPVYITVIAAHRGFRRGIRVHRVTHLDPDERTTRLAIPITTPERTLIDLAGSVGSRELELAVARGEREGFVQINELKSLVNRYAGRPGVAMLRGVLSARGGPALTRSEAESRFLQLVRQARLPAPEANVNTGPYELDFLWRAEGIAVEVDGFAYHSSRPRFEGDRRKDSWLLARGITVMRLSWRQLADEAVATAVQVGQALARARR